MTILPPTPVLVTVPATLEYSSLVREAARDFFVQAGFPVQWVRRLVLVTDELFMNAVKYGSEPTDVVEVVFENTEAGATVHVTDTNHNNITPEHLLER